VLETFVKMQPRRIVYVSCNPASLARDLAVLAEFGYVTKEIQPVDMFSQTFHVESVALIERE
jgi:23S rRNA (uracil1939-C5)-methyltransferase